MVSEEKITLEPVTPHLKFKRDNWGNILSLQYKEDGFSEESGDDENQISRILSQNIIPLRI